MNSIGGLLARTGRLVDAQHILEQAIHIARTEHNTVLLATVGGNLGILLLNQGNFEAAETMFQEALAASRQVDAHWLTAHLIGHLGVLARERGALDAASAYYQNARTLVETTGDRRNAILWTLNQGIVYYEQGRWDEAITLLETGKTQARLYTFGSLEAGADIFIGACLAAKGQYLEGLARIECGLAQAQGMHDQERTLMGYLHRGRVLGWLNRLDEARLSLEEGLRQAEACRMRRMANYFHTEIERLSLEAES